MISPNKIDEAIDQYQQDPRAFNEALDRLIDQAEREIMELERRRLTWRIRAAWMALAAVLGMTAALLLGLWLRG